MNHKEFAVATALEAGKLIMQHYGKLQTLEWKLATNFKIQVDDLSDELIRKRIRENFPNYNIYSEEQKDLEKSSEFSWVIDPLDGTIPYTFGLTDHFSVCVALVKNKTPILGVIYAPKRDELYVGEQEKGAFCNGKKIHVSSEEEINHSLVGIDGGKESTDFKRSSLASYYERLYSSNGISCAFCSGCASVPLALTASGRLNAYIALSLEPWDMAAAVIINREAGAKVTNLRGREWLLGDESIFSANPKLHESLSAFLK